MFPFDYKLIKALQPFTVSFLQRRGVSPGTARDLWPNRFSEDPMETWGSFCTQGWLGTGQSIEQSSVVDGEQCIHMHKCIVTVHTVIGTHFFKNSICFIAAIFCNSIAKYFCASSFYKTEPWSILLDGRGQFL